MKKLQFSDWQLFAEEHDLSIEELIHEQCSFIGSVYVVESHEQGDIDISKHNTEEFKSTDGLTRFVTIEVTVKLVE